MSEVLLALIIILQLLDAWTTFRVLEQGGREMNPLLAWAMSGIGVTLALVIAKGTAIAAFIIAYLLAPATVFMVMAAGIAVVYAWVVWHNWGQLR